MLIKLDSFADQEMLGILSRMTHTSMECLGAIQRVAQLPDARLYWHVPRMVEYPWVFKQIKSKGEKILDVGTGLQFWIALHAWGYDVTIHHTQHDLDHMGATSTGVGWCSGSTYLRDRPFKALVGLPQDLDFVKDGYFDTILNVSVMEHVPAVAFEPWLDGLWRLLRPGGKMICTCDWPYEYPLGEGVEGNPNFFINHDWSKFIQRVGADVTEADGVPWANGAENRLPDGAWTMAVSPDHPPTEASVRVRLAVYGFVLHKP